MTEFGYHASHEQFPPGDLVRYTEQAEEYGFTEVLASDHFHPWSERQGEAGHVWTWLGAAMEATSLSFGTVNAPGYRYHPAVIAQAAATLRRMFPERFWLSVGSGELLNEHITGEKWPTKADRNERLEECIAVMRRLWDGETVTHHGHVTVEDATLFTRPETNPPVIGAALSEETARWLGGIADGMITVGTPDLDHLETVTAAFRDRAPKKPIYVKAQRSYPSTIYRTNRRSRRRRWTTRSSRSSVMVEQNSFRTIPSRSSSPGMGTVGSVPARCGAELTRWPPVVQADTVPQ